MLEIIHSVLKEILKCFMISEDKITGQMYHMMGGGNAPDIELEAVQKAVLYF
ncbi:hypothetical protein ACVXZZ_13145 [Staphylococcus aureus]